MVAASGLQPMPFDSVTPSRTSAVVPSGSSRYSAPPPLRRSAATVPAQNRPAGSQNPSLNRTSSAMAGGRSGPPVSRPGRTGPVAVNATGVDVDPDQAACTGVPDRPLAQLGSGGDGYLPAQIHRGCLPATGPAESGAAAPAGRLTCPCPGSVP